MAKVRHIDGVDDVIKIIENSPAAVYNMTKKSFRDAGKVGRKMIYSKAPKHFRKLVKYTIYDNQKENIVLGIGYLPKSKLNIGGISMYRVAYWHNYGTLTRRDPSHQFLNPIKKIKRRNNIGQHHQNFFEAGTVGVDAKVIMTIQDSMKKYEDELNKK